MKAENTESYQLQIFNAVTRSYEPIPGVVCYPSYDERNANVLIARAGAKRWRVCRADRPLKPPRAKRAALTAGYSRSIADVQREYLAWAQSKGLESVHVYAGKLPPNSSPKFDYRDSRGERVTVAAVPRIFAGAMTTITPEEHFAVIETVAPVMAPLRTVEGFYIQAGA